MSERQRVNAVHEPSMGLVLGAGGATAWMFHIGVLETLADDFGLEQFDFEPIVGTSAGASVAASLIAGVSVHEFHARAIRPPTQEERDQMVAALKAAKKSLIPISPGLVREALPQGRGATLAIAGILPAGIIPTDWLADLPGINDLSEWPDRLWVPATRATDGSVVVFGRDSTDVSVVDALEASSAVPGMFRPKRIGDETFLDGGIRSSTHANLLIGSNADTAVISAPMSKTKGGVFSRNAHASLQREKNQLRRAGLNVIAIEPPDGFAEVAKGYPRRRPEAAADIVAIATEATRAAMARALA